jgi:hypothetical protein
MSILLFGAGAIAFVAGAVMAGFGVPVHEFSFGNTLILSGVVAMVGGLIVAGLGLVVSHIQQLTDALTRGAPLRSGRPLMSVDAAGRLPSAPARIPFPPRPKTDQKSDMALRGPADFEPLPETPFSSSPSDNAAPSLPNPDEAPVTVEDEVSLSPRHPLAPAPPADLDEPLPAPPFSARADQPERDRPQDQPSIFEAAWRTSPKEAQGKPVMPKASAPKAMPPMPVPPMMAASRTVTPPPPRQNAYFDSMWPTEPKEDKTETPTEPQLEARTETAAERKFQSPFAPPLRAAPTTAGVNSEPLPPAAEEAAEPTFAWQNDEESAQTEEPRTVAILKSGVVDGMGYTLYVDGSIEAELPQGTLHFASINELRSHLEKTS